MEEEERNSKLKEVIIYLIAKLGGKLDSRTKLVKLLYFIDRHSAEEQNGKTITGVEYFYHYYGPYSRDIIEAVHDLEREGIILEEYDPVAGMYRYYLNGEIQDLEITLNDEERRIINDIVRDYGNLSASKLKEIAYEYLEKDNKNPGDKVLPWS